MRQDLAGLRLCPYWLSSGGEVCSDDLLRPACADTCYGWPENLGGVRRVGAAGRAVWCSESGKPEVKEPALSLPRPLSGAGPSLPAGCHVGCPEVSPATVRPLLCPRAARLSRGLGGHAGHPARLGLWHLPGRLESLDSLCFLFHLSACDGRTRKQVEGGHTLTALLFSLEPPVLILGRSGGREVCKRR